MFKHWSSSIFPATAKKRSYCSQNSLLMPHTPNHGIFWETELCMVGGFSLIMPMKTANRFLMLALGSWLVFKQNLRNPSPESFPSLFCLSSAFFFPACSQKHQWQGSPSTWRVSEPRITNYSSAQHPLTTNLPYKWGSKPGYFSISNRLRSKDLTFPNSV